jgi:hypothetical protein
MGFSQFELADERFENPFEVGQYYLDNPDELDEMNSEYGEDCYAMRITAEGNLLYDTVEDGESLIEVPDKCKDDAGDTDVLRYRFHIAYTLTSHALDCFEGFSQESCDQLRGKGIADDEGGGGGPGGPVDPITGCPSPSPGNNPGAGIMVSIAGITNVHPCIEDNVRRMVAAAAADGITLTGNAYRSEDEQVRLRIQNGCPDIYDSPSSSCRVPTARPGSSQHNVGTAIDMKNMCFPNSTCVGNANYDWLVANAGGFGFQKLDDEAWHWSINGQ